MHPPRLRAHPSLFLPGICILMASLVLTRQGRAQQAKPAEPEVAKPGLLAPSRLKDLGATTDGVELAAWHYPAPEAAPPLANVILVHDLGGSHLTVEPLAKALQAAGCTVVSADLRGHGESKMPRPATGGTDPTKSFRRADLEMIAASAGGRVRDQAGVRGDLECLRTWIKRGIDAGTISRAPLFVVGSGVGALLGSAWTIADASWPENTDGPQGREVAGLVLVSPPFVTKGVQFSPLLASETIGHEIPVLVIAGQGDRDAAKVFDVVKRRRPETWFDSRFPQGENRGASPASPDDASLLMFTLPVDRSGDELAAMRARRDPASLVQSFIKSINGKNR